MLMNEILKSFSFKSIQETARIIKSFLKKEYSVDDFIEFAKKEKEDLITEDMEERINSLGEVENIPLTEKTKKEIQKEHGTKVSFLKPGELELMTGVLCSKCGSEVYTTAVCCSNPLKLQGFLRKTICSSCGIENGQK